MTQQARSKELTVHDSNELFVARNRTIAAVFAFVFQIVFSRLMFDRTLIALNYVCSSPTLFFRVLLSHPHPSLIISTASLSFHFSVYHPSSNHSTLRFP